MLYMDNYKLYTSNKNEKTPPPKKRQQIRNVAVDVGGLGKCAMRKKC